MVLKCERSETGSSVKIYVMKVETKPFSMVQ